MPSPDIKLTDDVVVVDSKQGKMFKGYSNDGKSLLLDKSAPGIDQLKAGKILLLSGITVVRATQVDDTPDGGGPGNGQATGPGAGRSGEPTVLDHVGPYPIRTSRERVTVEDAPVILPNPQLSLLHAPNEITNRDFEGWVQERSIYHASNWDSHYETIFSMHDAGEKEDEGSLITAKYGKGNFVYTGLVFFRELPAGVAGSYRLLANIIALNHKKGF